MRATPRLAVDVRAALEEPTGIGVCTRELVTALAERGRLEVVGMAHREPRGDGWMRQSGIAFEAQPAPSGVVWQQLVLPRRLARGDVDLLWSPLQTLPLFGSLPAVTTVHDLTTLILPETHRLKVRLTQLPFLARSLQRARRVVAVSQATADDIAAHYPEVKPRLRVIHNGVGGEFQPATAEAIAATRAELGMPDGYLLYAGTLEPRKNLPLLLDAWEALREDDAEHDRTTLPLVIAGGYGWKSRELVERLQGLRGQGVVALGRVDQERLVRLVQGTRCFVYPSLYEGFGLPAIEALACGVPVVSTRTSSLPEVVGDAALLVDPHDPAELADAIRSVLTQPALAQRLAAAGPPQAARFSWQRSAVALEGVLLEALTEAA